MRFRTLALALALVCGFSATMQAKRPKITTAKHAVKAPKVHKQKVRHLKVRKRPK
jgi:hypothetical protein